LGLRSLEYLALLLALDFNRCCKLVLSFFLASWLLSLPDSFALDIFLLFSMAGQNLAKNFFERAWARGSDSNKDSINGKEVKKEFQEGTKKAN